MSEGPGPAWSRPRVGGRRPRGALRWVLLALVAVPLLELVVLVWVAHRIGGWTVLLLLAAAVLGALVLKHGGPSTFRRVREAARAGRPPTGELADAFLTVLGGVLLLVPGFVTDVVGLACLVPPFRWGARVLLVRLMARAVTRGTVSFRTAHGRVVRGRVVDGTRRSDDDGRRGAAGPPVLEGRVLPPFGAPSADSGEDGTGHDGRGQNGKGHDDWQHNKRGLNGGTHDLTGEDGGGRDDDDRPRRGG